MRPFSVYCLEAANGHWPIDAVRENLRVFLKQDGKLAELEDLPPHLRRDGRAKIRGGAGGTVIRSRSGICVHEERSLNFASMWPLCAMLKVDASLLNEPLELALEAVPGGFCIWTS